MLHPVTAQSSVFTIPDRKTGVHRITVLSGKWEFYWKKLYKSMNVPEDCTIFDVPQDWSGHTAITPAGNVSYPSNGYACYRTVIKNLVPDIQYAFFMRCCPNTASIFYVNGQETVRTGSFSVDYENSIPKKIPVFFTAFPDDNGNIELAIQVSNYVHRKAGILSPVYFAEEPVLFDYYNECTAVVMILAGMLLILLLIHCILFTLGNSRRKRDGYLFLFLISITIRLLISQQNMLSLYFPRIPYDILLKIEYSPMWIGPLALMAFIFHSLPHLKNRITIAYTFFYILLGFITFLLPEQCISSMVPLLLAGAIIAVIVTTIILLIPGNKFDDLSRKTILIYTILATGIFIDYFIPEHTKTTPVSISQGVIFAFVITDLTYFIFCGTGFYRERLELIKNLQTVNKRYLDFVPDEFLKLLGKNRPSDVMLGDSADRELTVVFLLYTVVTTTGSALAPERLYETTFQYDAWMATEISKHGGFISKFLSNGMVLLFPCHTDKKNNSVINALSCCVEIYGKITNINNSRKITGAPTIHLGMGIHYGKVILGTIGEESRMEDTVISDAVNTAFRIGTVSEKLNVPVLISRTALTKTGGKLPYGAAFLGNIPLKGKRKPVSLFACFPGPCNNNTATVTKEMEKNFNKLVKELWL